MAESDVRPGAPSETPGELQVMNRPRRGGDILEGEEAGPSYGAVNGVLPATESRRSGASSVLPLGRLTSDREGQRRDSQERPEAARTDEARPAASTTLTASSQVLRQQEAADLPSGSAANVRETGVGATTDVRQQQPAPPPPLPQPSSSTQQQPTAQQPEQPKPAPPRLLQPLQRVEPGQGRDRLPPPLQNAVQQLAQQRTAVVQAVQSRAQRALYARQDDNPGHRDGSVFASPESLVGSPPAQQQLEEQTGGFWSVTRVSEVLHQRLVAPVLEHVRGADAGPQPSPTWTPMSTGDVEGSLLSPQTRRAMAAWTAQPTTLTTPIAEAPAPRDDSSAGSLSRDVVMEEVKRQVQIAMQGRDAELQALRNQNVELQGALTASAQLLNEVIQSGGGEPGPVLPEAMRGPPGTEPRGDPPGEDQGSRRAPRAPPGLLGPSSLSGSNLLGRGQDEPRPSGNPFGLSGHAGPLGDNLEAGGAATSLRVPRQGSFEGPDLCEDKLGGAETSPLEVLVQGMKQLQQVYLEKKLPEAEALKGNMELPQLPDLSGESAMEFSDWLYVAEQIVGSMSDSSTRWFAETLKCAKEAYYRHQLATPMERLTILPTVPSELAEPRWSRLERKVMTMLLTAMPKPIREDAVTHRVGTVAGVLFRLHVLYQPGGVAERAAILKQLEGGVSPDSVAEAVAQLRKWRRTLTRVGDAYISPGR